MVTDFLNERPTHPHTHTSPLRHSPVLVLNPDSNLAESILHFRDDFIAFCGASTCLNSISDSLPKCLHKEIVSDSGAYNIRAHRTRFRTPLILVDRIEIYIRRAPFYLSYHALLPEKKTFPGTNIIFFSYNNNAEIYSGETSPNLRRVVQKTRLGF